MSGAPKRRVTVRRVLAALLAVVAVVGVVGAIWLAIPQQVLPEADAALIPSASVAVEQNDGNITFVPTAGADVGLMSVPCAKYRAPCPASPLPRSPAQWGRIGALGFGGPPAHVALLRDLTSRKGWIDAREFEDAFATCSLLPGPASTQMAIYCAQRVAGRTGAARRRPRVHPARPARLPGDRRGRARREAAAGRRGVRRGRRRRGRRGRRAGGHQAHRPAPRPRLRRRGRARRGAGGPVRGRDPPARRARPARPPHAA